MRWLHSPALYLLFTAIVLLQRPPIKAINSAMASSDKVQTFDKSTPSETWKNYLSEEEYRVLRMKGTEMRGSGQYNKHQEDGVYRCAGCGAVLYSSEHKFDSGCGWPAFYDEVPGAVERHVDTAFGMKRVEITCTSCGGHLGHVFEGEGFKTPKDVRHCVNSVSLKFEPKKAEGEQLTYKAADAQHF